MKKRIILLIIVLFGVLLSVVSFKIQARDQKYIDKKALTIDTRFLLPKGYIREETKEGTFERYLQTYPLKAYGKRARFYNGKINRSAPKYGVLDKDISLRNLEQCADTCIRLYSEYLYEREEYEKISFSFVSGFVCDYISFAEGKRVKLEGNDAYWYEAKEIDYSYKTFREYLDLIFQYANTSSLQRDLEVVTAGEIQIGDIFVMTGAQMGRALGHAVIVMDICVNIESGQKLYLIGEGTTPASEAYIVKSAKGPWISLEEDGSLKLSGFSCPSQYIRRMG